MGILAWCSSQIAVAFLVTSSFSGTPSVLNSADCGNDWSSWMNAKSFRLAKVSVSRLEVRVVFIVGGKVVIKKYLPKLSGSEHTSLIEDVMALPTLRIAIGRFS